MEMFRSHVLICGGTGCTSSKSDQIEIKFNEILKEKGLDNEVKVVRTGCFGLCEAGPIVIVYPEGAFYSHIKIEDVNEIVEEHLYKGRIVKRLLYKGAIDEDTIKSLNQVEFYSKQKRIVLSHCGVINPEDITEYIAYNGYEALGKVVTEMTPQQVIDIVKASGLRGRGGLDSQQG